MAKEYTVTIEHLKGAPSHDGKTNVITQVEYQIVGVDGEYSHNIYGNISVDYDADNFIEFDDLEEADVIAWVEAHPAYTNNINWLSEFIDNMKVPMDVGLQKPW